MFENAAVDDEKCETFNNVECLTLSLKIFLKHLLSFSCPAKFDNPIPIDLSAVRKLLESQFGIGVKAPS